MFRTLHIQGYRRFKDYRLENLSRVNLLVGDNNSGKTSVLEAVQLLALNDPHEGLDAIARRRGERVYVESEQIANRGRWYPTLRHCFFKHDPSVGQRIHIVSQRTEAEDVGLDIEIIGIIDAPPRQLLGGLRLSKAVRFKSTQESRPWHFGIDDDGVFDSTISWDRRQRPHLNAFLVDREFSADQLRSLWNYVNEVGKAISVVEALQSIDENIDRVHFDVVAFPPLNPRTAVRIGTAENSEFLPIGSFGQGVFRMLELALGHIASENGVFLVDEIDNGFHWTRMADIWKFVIETARQTNTQVFATTHSEDCIKGLASVCSEHPELAEEVSLQSLKTALDFSVSVTGDRLPFVVGQEIEVR